MPLQYWLIGGQLIIERLAFSKELLLYSGPIHKLLGTDGIQPTKIKSNNNIIIDFDHASDIKLDEGFYDLFKSLKGKYKEKVKGRVVIQITALTSYHVILNMNTEDDKIIYE